MRIATIAATRGTRYHCHCTDLPGEPLDMPDYKRFAEAEPVTAGGTDAAASRFHHGVKRSPFARLTLLALFTLSSLTATAAELRIGGEELAAVIQSAFRGTTIRLHHDVDGKPASFIRLAPQLGGETMTFSLPPREIPLALGATARYAVDDVNSLPVSGTAPDAISVHATEDTFVITIRFESEGTEIKGTPGGRWARLREGAVPDLQVDGILLHILLTPIAGQRVAFQPARVVFDGDVQARGTKLSLFGWSFDLLDEITNYKLAVKSSIEREVKALVDRNLPAVARTVETEVARRTAGSGLQVANVRFTGTTLTITGRVAP